MQLKLKKLQGIVKEAMKNEKFALQLMRECLQTFGPSVDVSSDPRRVFAAVNDKLSILETRGYELPVGSIKVSTLLSAADTSKEARKIAARLLPEKYAIKFLRDRDSGIRCAAANRFSYGQIKEALDLYPHDDQLSTIALRKKIFEAGIPKPKEADPHLDIYGDAPLGDVMDGYHPDDLTDGWYKRTAKKIFDEHKGRFDGNWKNLAVSRLTSSIYATSGVKVDAMKLYQELNELIDTGGMLEESYGVDHDLSLFLERSGADPILPVLEETLFVNSVKKLLSEASTRSSFIKTAESLFEVTHHVVNDSLDEQEEIPQFGKLPEGVSWDSSAEQALDKYVKNWNDKSKSSGSRIKIDWNYGFNDKINFVVVNR